MAGGRPTKYDKKYAEELLKYFDIEPHFETPVIVTSKGVTKETVKYLPSDLPTLAGFAKKIGIHRETLLNWADEKLKDAEGNDTTELAHPEFFDAIKRAKDCQEAILVTNALHGSYNPAFSIFFAKNNLNWSDKQEVDHTTKGEKIKTVVGFNYVAPNGSPNTDDQADA